MGVGLYEGGGYSEDGLKHPLHKDFIQSCLKLNVL